MQIIGKGRGAKSRNDKQARSTFIFNRKREITNHNTMKNTITKADVLIVAHTLRLSPTETQIKYVIDTYESECEEDPTGVFDLIIEKLLYDVISPKAKTKDKGEIIAELSEKVRLLTERLNACVTAMDSATDTIAQWFPDEHRDYSAYLDLVGEIAETETLLLDLGIKESPGASNSDTVKRGKVYFLFGEDICSTMLNDGIESVKEELDNGAVGALYMFDERTDYANDLIGEFNGYGDFAILTKEQYDFLKPIEVN